MAPDTWLFCDQPWGKCQSARPLQSYWRNWILQAIDSHQILLRGRKSWRDLCFQSGNNVENNLREGSLEAGKPKFKTKKRRAQEMSEQNRQKTSNLAANTLNQGKVSGGWWSRVKSKHPVRMRIYRSWWKACVKVK